MVVFNESTPLDVLAKELRNRVCRLLFVYVVLVVVSFLFSAALIAGAGWILWEMVIGDLVTGRMTQETLSYGNVKLGIFLAILAVTVAAAWIHVVFAPLIKLMRPKKVEGVEIFREDNPQLFELIDEVAQISGNQSADVKHLTVQMPGHVFLTDKCNFYVTYTNILGFAFSKYRVLSLGIPLMMPLNRQEFKAVLAHELKHFMQGSVAVNNIANISEFICGAISQTYVDYEESEHGIDRYIKLLAKGAYRIMQWQYEKVAPLNGILSRAQELDADRFSANAAGADAAVSALSKIACMKSRWENRK